MSAPRYMTPGARDANAARWAGLTPEQRAAEQAYADNQARLVDERTRRARRFGNLIKWGVIGTVGAGAGYGALAPLLAGGAPAAGAGSVAGGAAGSAGAAGAATLPAAATAGIGFSAAPTVGGAAGGGLFTAQNLARAGNVGRVFGDAAKGSSDQRYGENQQALLLAQMQNQDALSRANLQNQNATTRAGMQNSDNQFRAGLDLERRRFLQSEPNAQARRALGGSLLSRIQPMRAPSGFTQNPSILDAIGPEAREAGSLLAQRGLSGLQSGPTQFAELPGVSLPDTLNLPPAVAAQMQRSGLLEKIMGGMGTAASVVGALGDLESVHGYGG